jgi:hypothetical protein
MIFSGKISFIFFLVFFEKNKKVMLQGNGVKNGFASRLYEFDKRKSKKKKKN